MYDTYKSSSNVASVRLSANLRRAGHPYLEHSSWIDAWARHFDNYLDKEAREVARDAYLSRAECVGALS